MKTYSSKEEFEKRTPYVAVQFEEFDNETFATEIRGFSNKKTGENWLERQGFPGGVEIMTRNKFEKEALMSV